jgi:6-pyruvoyl-tetrahydropterin synthase
MDRRVARLLLDKVDHRNLNDVFDEVTTGENLALLFQGMLAPAFPEADAGPRLAAVRVYETARNIFETLEEDIPWKS